MGYSSSLVVQDFVHQQYVHTTISYVGDVSLIEYVREVASAVDWSDLQALIQAAGGNHITLTFYPQ